MPSSSSSSSFVLVIVLVVIVAVVVIFCGCSFSRCSSFVRCTCFCFLLTMFLFLFLVGFVFVIAYIVVDVVCSSSFCAVILFRCTSSAAAASASSSFRPRIIWLTWFSIRSLPSSSPSSSLVLVLQQHWLLPPIFPSPYFLQTLLFCGVSLIPLLRCEHDLYLKMKTLLLLPLDETWLSSFSVRE